MKILSTLLIILIYGFEAFSQPFEKYTYEVPAHVPEAYQHDPIALYNQILNQIDREAKQKHLERYAELVAFGVSEDFEQGLVYMGWDKAEDYLNEVFQKLMAESGEDLKNMKVYFMRSPVVNAYTKPNGSMYITAGLMAELEDEASLACVLGHEVDHYLQKDGENKFFDNLKNYNRKNRNTKDVRIEMAHENQENEHRCDRFGWTLARDAGYRMESFRSHLLTFALNEESSEKWNRRLSTEGRKKEEDLNYLLASHPEAAERLDSLEKFIKESRNTNEVEGKSFIVDKERFNYLKYQSKLQVLELYKEQNWNMAMFERGFAYLLLEPENPYYLQFTLEALRRVMYFEPDRIALKVLNDHYPDLPEIENWDKLLANMMKYPERIEMAETSIYLQKFEKVPTYLDLLTYLEEQVMKTGNTEGFLSLALYYRGKDKSKFERYIDHYSSLQDAAHKAYADLLKEDALRESTGEQAYFILDEIVMVEDHYYGIHRRDLLSRKMNSSLVNEVERMVDDVYSEDVKTLAISDLQQNNLRRYLAFKNISNTVYFYQTKFENVTHSESYEAEEIVFTSNGSQHVNDEDNEVEDIVDKSDLFEYSPEVWKLYRDENIKSLNVAYGSSFDERGQFWRVLVTCCTPYSSLIYFISNGSSRYQYKVGYLEVDLKDQEYEDVDEVYYAKFTTKRYVKKLRKLIKSTR